MPSTDRATTNRHCTRVAATGAGHARNLAVAASGDVLIAIGESWGTLSEIAFARTPGRPIVMLRGQTLAGVIAAEAAQEAVSVALAAVRAG